MTVTEKGDKTHKSFTIFTLDLNQLLPHNPSQSKKERNISSSLHSSVDGLQCSRQVSM